MHGDFFEKFLKLLRQRGEGLLDNSAELVFAHDVQGGSAMTRGLDLVAGTAKGDRNEVANRVIVLNAQDPSNSVEVNFANLIDQRNRTIALQGDLLDLVFVEK